MPIKNVTIGSDVEFFVSNGKDIVSAEGLIRGTKSEPHRYDPDNAFFATQLDNVLAEGNIPPAKTADEFITYLNSLRGTIDSMLPAGHSTVAKAAHVMDKKFMTEHAKVFGCDPSQNAWTFETVFPQPDPKSTLRSAGFHIHIGYNKPNLKNNIDLIRAMDLLIGVPGILMEPASDRRKVGYGQSGNFRPQNHGVEYRTLSSYFVSSPEIIRWCFDTTMAAVEYANTGDMRELASLGGVVQDIINNEDKEAAHNLIASRGIPMPNFALEVAA